jgi:predicted GNAT family acetyltransferase
VSELFDERRRGDYRLTDDAGQLSLDVMHAWLSREAYWARGRSREAVATSVAHSHLYGIVHVEGEMVACARMITDQVSFGWIGDVFVAEAHRGRGLATWMVGEIVEHWSAQGLHRIMLATRDAQGVYAKVGFQALAHPEHMMEIDRRPAF